MGVAGIAHSPRAVSTLLQKQQTVVKSFFAVVISELDTLHIGDLVVGITVFECFPFFLNP